MALAACHMLDDVRIQQSQTMSYVYLMLVQRLRRWPNIKPRWPSVSPLLGSPRWTQLQSSVKSPTIPWRISSQHA